MSQPNEVHLLNKRIALRQPEQGFRPGLDSVMLAAACPAEGGQSVLDLGCGVGSAGLCVLARVPGVTLTGIDIQEDHIALARENAALNDMEERAEFISSCITELCDMDTLPPYLNYVKSNRGGRSNTAPKTGAKKQVSEKHRFDHIICNPPYLEAGNHLRSPDEQKATANGHEGDTSLEDWLRAAFENLRSGGTLSMIHRANMVDKIIQGLGKSYGAIEIIPLWPKAGVPAKRVIIRAIKDRKSPSIINPGIVLHEENGDYTPEAEEILRGAAAIT